MRALLVKHKASPYFESRADVEIAAEDAVVYGDIVELIKIAAAEGFANWSLISPSALSVKFMEQRPHLRSNDATSSFAVPCAYSQYQASLLTRNDRIRSSTGAVSSMSKVIRLARPAAMSVCIIASNSPRTRAS